MPVAADVSNVVLSSQSTHMREPSSTKCGCGGEPPPLGEAAEPGTLPCAWGALPFFGVCDGDGAAAAADAADAAAAGAEGPGADISAARPIVTNCKDVGCLSQEVRLISGIQFARPGCRQAETHAKTRHETPVVKHCIQEFPRYEKPMRVKCRYNSRMRCKIDIS